jgi:HlyD family secretion protein
MLRTQATRLIGRNWGAAAIVLLFFVAGCAQAPTPTPMPAATPIPAVALNPAGGSVRASGKIVPARSAELAFPSAGRVLTLTVDAGDRVEADALLAALDDTAAVATVAQAQAAVQQAQAQLEERRAGPRSQEVTATQARLDAVQARLDQLTQAARPEDVAAAQTSLAAAQAHYDALYAEPSEALLADARAKVQQAQAALDRLLNPATMSQIAEAKAQVRSAQAELELLQAGARPETLAVAQAAVAEAEAALQSAKAELAATELHAPFGGTVTAVKVSEGEMVLPGEVVLILADLDSLRAETTDLSERDVARVEIGQPATVLVEPLQTEVPGKVARIAPQASVIGGDVVYTVVVALDTQPEGLRWGMSADVEIQTEPAVTP